MLRRGAWVAAGGALLCVGVLVTMAIRGPVSDRAPVRAGGGGHAPDPAAVGGASARVDIGVLPAGGAPGWRLELRDAQGRLHERSGTGAQSCVIASLPAGRLLCTVRASGFVGATRRLEVVEGRDLDVALVLRQFGRVVGSVRCAGAPIAGTLVHLTLLPESASVLVDLAPEDRGIAMTLNAESDADGRYRIDRVPPAAGFTLVAADFDHPPVRAGPMEVGPGADVTVDFAMIAGAHLSGRVVDAHGKPCEGSTVNVLRQQTKRDVVTWEEEARARTDENGRFVTPALVGSASRMLKLWIVVDGIHQVIQHVTSLPDRGTKDIGLLAPLSGIVQFEATEPLRGKTFTITVSSAGDAASGIVLAGLPLEADGRLRLSGLPPGEVLFDVLNAEGRSVHEGRFHVDGRDILVTIPSFHVPAEEAEPHEAILVDVAESGEGALLLVAPEGRVVAWQEVQPGRRERLALRVGPGTYALHLRIGDRVGRRDVTQSSGKDEEVTIATDRPGRTLGLRILRDGSPAAKASVLVRGLKAGAYGQRVPWAQAGEDGRAILRGLPDDVATLEVTILMPDGHGRSYALDVEGKEDATIDLAAEQD